MVDLTALKRVMDDSGMTMTAISKKSGILRETLYNRLKGVGEFTASEIVELSRTLHLTTGERDEIFFAPKVELKETIDKN